MGAPAKPTSGRWSDVPHRMTISPMVRPTREPGSAEMGFSTRWVAWFTRKVCRTSDGVHRPFADPADELPVEPERPWGCGWFDSSLDLRQGLAVIEHAQGDLALALEQMLAPERALQ